LNGIGSDHAVSFVDAFDEMQLLIHQRLKDFFGEFKQRRGIGKREKQIKHCAQIIDDFADEIINATRSSDNHDRPDVVSTYLSYCEEQGEPAPTNQELRDLVISMVLAGRDTTAAALTWTIYELTKNPDVVRQIREEVDQVCRGRELSFELVHKLPYTHAVVMESLCLHPPVPDTFRFLKNADVLPDGTHIPAGVLVMFSINSINNSEKLWKDPDTFNPERFFDDTMEPSQFKFPTFSGGPRVCPGKPLAMMELTLCLAFLLPR
jgi:cytochrome P450